MKYRSTQGSSPEVSLEEAVVKGLAPDNGLYMPVSFPSLPESFFNRLPDMSLQDMAAEISSALFGEDIDKTELERITRETLSFPIPLVKVSENIYSLELFHGPTLAFKDVGARFMARMLGYFNRDNQDRMVNVLVATSGDTGSAVANGFLNVDGVRVFVLYPKGKVSKIQEAQFTTLGHNITAVEVDGTFDDCQSLVKKAFLDEELNQKMKLTSANSINVARFLPQMFYYFHAWGQAVKAGANPKEIVVCVPSGNFGNITAGLIAKRMGLPIRRFIAANNANDIFFQYLNTGDYCPKKSVQTIANAMDVGNPSNFARVLDLFNHSHVSIKNEIAGATYSDDEISDTMVKTYKDTGYILDPHGAVGYQAVSDLLKDGETGIFLETAHPAKFKDTVDKIINEDIEIPQKIKDFMKGEKKTENITTSFEEFKNLLLSQA